MIGFYNFYVTKALDLAMIPSYFNLVKILNK